MHWFAATLVTATVLVWLAVAVAHRVRVSAATKVSDESSLRWIVVLAWSYSVVPPLLGLIEIGRQRPRFGTLADVAAMQVTVSTALAATIALLCFRIIATNLSSTPAAGFGTLAAFLAPWFLIQIVPGIASSYLAGLQVVLYPLIALAFWLASPPLRVIATVGYAVAATAGISIAFAALSPLALVDIGPAGTEKALITSGPELLAGPYNHPNSLGLVLALGSPAILAIPRRRVRTLGLAMVAPAVLWSASRTSVIALAIVLLVYLVARFSSVARFRAIGAAAIVAGLVISAWLPFDVMNPLAYSQRGAIWIASRDIWREHFWVGAGPKFYERPNDLGFYALYGHNLPIDTLIRGGLLAGLAIAVFGYVALLRSFRLAGLSPVPLLVVVALAYTSLLEVPLLFDNLGILGFVTWVPLAVIFFTRDSVGLHVRRPDQSAPIYAPSPAQT